MKYAFRDFAISFDKEEDAIAFCLKQLEKRLQWEKDFDARDGGEYHIIEISEVKRRKPQQLHLDVFRQTFYRKIKHQHISRGSIYTSTVQCSYQIIDDNFQEKDEDNEE